MATKTGAVIVRRQKKPGHAQRHGGHWKVAYADFMTAMMAFFLLLWILSVTDKSKLDGIAQYFTPTENVAGQPGGEGVLQGSTLSEQENVLSAPPAEQAQNQQGAPNPWAELAAESRRSDTAQAPPGEALDRAGQTFLDSVRSRADLANLAGNLLVRQIEGQLVIDIIDLGDQPMFDEGAEALTADMQQIFSALAPTIMALPHPVRITGHTGKTASESPSGKDNWSLSGARAQNARIALTELGLDPARFTLISGAGSSRPLDPLSPDDPKNRRITIELGSALDP